MDNAMLAKLTKGDRVIAVSAILFLLFSFLPWYGKGGGSRNGWDYFFFGVIPVLLALVMLAQVLVSRLSNTKLPELPITWAQVHAILAGIITALVLLRLLITDKVDTGVPDDLGGILGDLDIPSSISLDRKYGLILAFLAAIGLVVGAVFKVQDPADAGETGDASPPTT